MDTRAWLCYYPSSFKLVLAPTKDEAIAEATFAFGSAPDDLVPVEDDDVPWL